MLTAFRVPITHAAFDLNIKKVDAALPSPSPLMGFSVIQIHRFRYLTLDKLVSVGSMFIHTGDYLNIVFIHYNLAEESLTVPIPYECELISGYFAINLVE